jgi:hypothetical protein
LLLVKRLSIAILALLYLGLTSGIVKNLHYCMGQLSNVEYGFDDHDLCGKCGMEEKDGCCDTELKIVKVEDSHQWVKSGSIAKSSFAISTPANSYSSFVAPISRRIRDYSYHSPPDRRTNLVYLHTGILLI